MKNALEDHVSHDKEFFEFLCELIDIQIKKYVALTKIGIGPDARLNARLVFNEVSELIQFAEILIKLIQNPSLDKQALADIYTQVKFYLEQEHIRAYAGWLLDENNIHTPGLSRVKGQLEHLNKIGQSVGIDGTTPSEPVTDIQKQCQHDSCSIAFYILDLAKQIIANPEMELDDNIPKHARMILKRNVVIRYGKSEFSKPIEELHSKYDAFLKTSHFDKSSSVLLSSDAKTLEKVHRGQWTTLLQSYRKIEPNSVLFDSKHEWSEIGKHSGVSYKTMPTSSFGGFRLFGAVAAGAVLIYMLMPHFVTQLEGEVRLMNMP
jgi:hypothetical protein